MRKPSMTGPRRQRGFTLIELMVSLVIGFAVVGALLAAYLASARTGGANDALVQMTEDATQALSVMRTQVAMAGYAVPVGVDAANNVTYATKVPLNPVFGCTNANFGDLAVEIERAVPCTGSTTSDTIEVAYEAVVPPPGSTSTNAIVDAAGKPLDCIGNAIPPEAGITPAVYVNDSKFYVDATNAANPTLSCRAHGANPGAPLVDHIEALKVTYGLNGGAGKPANQIETYRTTAPVPTDGFWQKVVAVTLCVRVRSANRMVDSVSVATLSTFVDCDNTVQKPTDGYLRRTFSTTVVLQNKL